jgi:hypothetical protein
MMHPRLGSSVWVAALALHIAVPASVHGQGQSARLHGPQWIVASDATTDLWFHSLAVLGLNGPGTLPFYDTRYAQRVSDEKARRGIAPSRLDRDAARLRRAIMADSAFELLHFIPLYLDRMSPEDLPRFLRHAAANPTALAPEEMVRLVRSSLPSSAQRAVLGRGVRATIRRGPSSERRVSGCVAHLPGAGRRGSRGEPAGGGGDSRGLGLERWPHSRRAAARRDPRALFSAAATRRGNR